MNDLSRKKFLQYTASAGAAVLLSSLESFAMDKDDKKLKVAVIGCGSVSGSLLTSIAYLRFDRNCNSLRY